MSLNCRELKHGTRTSASWVKVLILFDPSINTSLRPNFFLLHHLRCFECYCEGLVYHTQNCQLTVQLTEEKVCYFYADSVSGVHV